MANITKTQIKKRAEELYSKLEDCMDRLDEVQCS